MSVSARIGSRLVVLSLTGVVLGGSPQAVQAGGAELECHGRAATVVGTPGNDSIDDSELEPGDVVMTLAGRDDVDASVTDLVVCSGPGPDLVQVMSHEQGGADPSLLDGGPGKDYVGSNGGPTTSHSEDLVLIGGDGNDNLLGGLGDDLIDAGSGKDSVNGEWGSDRIRGQAGKDSLRGGEVHYLDMVSQGENDRIRGGRGRDKLEGAGGADRLSGGPGSDRLFGIADGGFTEAYYREYYNPGQDVGDVLRGGPGSDLLVGHAGRDKGQGDSGLDRCVTEVRRRCESGGPGFI